MKLIEAMKHLKVIEKRIFKNCEQITEYSALPDTERIHFGSKDLQVKEVRSLVQANKDLVQEYLTIKQKIDKTNLFTNVEINGKTYTISELLILKRTLAKMMISTYKAMNDTMARKKVNTIRSEKQPIIEKFYSETEKNEGERFWDDLYHSIDSRLEVINATTELLE